MRIFRFVIIQFLFCHSAMAFFNHHSTAKSVGDSVPQKDMIDVIQRIAVKKTDLTTQKSSHKLEVSVIPTLGYTLSTGFAIGASSIFTFHTQQNHNYNISVINAQAFYDSHSQETFFTQANIWLHNDDYKLVTDWRAVKYPDVTYGLGNSSIRADNINYNYIRLYQTLLRKIVPNYYVGVGYNFDYHFSIEDAVDNPTVNTAYKRYGGGTQSKSAGYVFDFLFDSRRNPVNALGGTFVNLIFRNNYTFLGSDVDCSSAVFDVRKYFKLSRHSNNVLAFWSYNWLVLSGRPPYLDLPSVGADMYNNTGRGYPIDRYRGRNMIYLEGEYRFGITNNGLLGGVLFANAANYSKNINQDLQNVIPAGGGGLRLKINKHSNTNLCVDYGVGTAGSRGFFVNLGEVF